MGWMIGFWDGGGRGAGDFSLRHRVQTGSGANPSSSKHYRGLFSRGKESGAWSWPLTSI